MCSSLVCLCHGSVYCTSVTDELEVCQHARCPEGLDIEPLCQLAVQVLQDCTHGLVYLFVMMIFDSFTLLCDSILAVFFTIYCLSLFVVYFIVLLDWIIMEDIVYSLCLAFNNCTFINHTVPDK